MKAAADAREHMAQALLALFAARGFRRIDPPILQPADVFLERSGEELRQKSFVFADPQGQEVCLRPELTIPAILEYLSADPTAASPARFCYSGPVFRAQPSGALGSAEQLQTGGEWLNIAGSLEEEAACMELALEGARLSGATDIELRIGDLGLFFTLVDALGLSALQAERLKRHFWRPAYFDAPDPSQSTASAHRPSALLRHVASLPQKEARALMEDVFALSAIRPAGARSVDEIIARYLEKAAEHRQGSTGEAAHTAAIRAFLEIGGPADTAITALEAFSVKHSMDLEKPLARLRERFAQLSGCTGGGVTVTFAANFGRDLEYYSGLVFDIVTRLDGHTVTLAGGGRYDGLVSSLSGRPGPHPSIGCAFQTETLALLAANNRRGSP